MLAAVTELRPGITTRPKTADDYPPMLQARHVQEFLGVSQAMAYNILNCSTCPTIRFGKRMVVNKDSFLRFLKEAEGKHLF